MGGETAQILVVDDDETIREMIGCALEQDGHTVFTASDGVVALEEFAAHEIDVVVLDLMLPGLDGLEVCRRLRAEHTVPIIMLTARGDELERVLGLEMGADDYVVKEKLSLRELRSRVKAQLRRAHMSQSKKEEGHILSVGDVTLDILRNTLTMRGMEKRLPHFEFEVLKVLMQHPGRIYSRQMLLELVWGDSDFRDERTVDTHIHYLRSAVEEDPRNPEYILTVRYVGYAFRAV